MVFPKNDFLRATPESQGVKSSAIISALEAIRASGKDIHSMLVIKNGNPLRKGWYTGEANGVVRVYLDGKFAGMAEAEEGGLVRFRAMLMEMSECV